jgi:uncharacterized protein
MAQPRDPGTVASAPPRPTPLVHDETRPWWDATQRGELLVQRCTACGHHQHYPRSLCTRCQSTTLEFVRASGRGTVYSYTVVHRAPHPAFTAPYVIALVRIDEGPVLLTRIVDCPIERVCCDMKVTVAWDPLPDGHQLPVFKPA